MFDQLWQPALAPFVVALGLMLALALIEVATALFGLGLTGMIESLLPDLELPDADLEGAEGAGAGPLNAVLAWLCIGRVPALVVLIAFLTAFGLVGLLVQHLALSLLGGHLATLVAVAATLVVALPLTRYLALAFAWILPQEETEAVEAEDFLGKVAAIFRGTARPGLPAEAKLTDRFGAEHYLLVEPAAGTGELAAGTRVLLVGRTKAGYLAVAADRDLAPGSAGEARLAG